MSGESGPLRSCCGSPFRAYHRDDCPVFTMDGERRAETVRAPDPMTAPEGDVAAMSEAEKETLVAWFHYQFVQNQTCAHWIGYSQCEGWADAVLASDWRKTLIDQAVSAERERIAAAIEQEGALWQEEYRHYFAVCAQIAHIGAQR